MPTVTKFADANAVVATGWTSATNAYADDAAYATAAPAKNGTISSDFGFPAFASGDIPDGSTITSVTVEVQWKCSTTSSVATLGAQLHNPAGTALGSETISATPEPIVDTIQTQQVTSGIALADLRNANTVVARTRCSRGNSNTAVTGTLDYVKLTVEYSVAHILTADSGSGTVTGSDAGLKADRKLSASSGAGTITGQDATLTVGGSDPVLAADSGAGVIAGSAAGLIASRKLAAESGSGTIAGSAATLRRASVLLAASGAGLITGSAAGGARGYAMQAEGGSGVIAGQSATLIAARRLVADLGAGTVSGQDAALTYSGGAPAAPARCASCLESWHFMLKPWYGPRKGR